LLDNCTPEGKMNFIYTRRLPGHPITPAATIIMRPCPILTLRDALGRTSSENTGRSYIKDMEYAPSQQKMPDARYIGSW
jgi:hypothetical protein